MRTRILPPIFTDFDDDYDLDGIDEIGIFRETTGLWAIMGLTRCYFGTMGDIPVTR